MLCAALRFTRLREYNKYTQIYKNTRRDLFTLLHQRFKLGWLKRWMNVVVYVLSRCAPVHILLLDIVMLWHVQLAVCTMIWMHVVVVWLWLKLIVVWIRWLLWVRSSCIDCSVGASR